MKKAPAFRQYPEWHCMPLRLTRAEIEKPAEVMKAFIKDYDLPAVRQNLEEMLNRVFISKTADPLKFIWFRDELERFIEAAYISRKSEKPRTPTPDLREFMAIISHEIQNQLAGMMAIISTIDSYKAKDGRHAAEAMAYFEMLKVAVTNAQAVYSNMQTSTKILATGFEITPQITPYYPYNLLNNIVASLLPIEQVQGNRIQPNILIEPDMRGHTDVNMFRQVFTNLLLNALKYSKPNSLIKLHALSSNDHLQVSVTTIGQRISKELQPRIFEPYFVLDKAKAGTGLGLYVCKTYCTALGGDIYVRSTSKGITAFTVTLPINSILNSVSK